MHNRREHAPQRHGNPNSPGSPGSPGFGGPPGYAGGPGFNGGPGFAPAPGFNGGPAFTPAPSLGPGRADDPWGPGGPQGAPSNGDRRKGPGSRRRRALIGVVVAVVILAVAGVFVGRKLLNGPTDPGCRDYANTALASYNKLISDLNAQAPQATLNLDMTTAVSQLTTATDQAQSASVKSAIGGLLSELETVRSDVAQGAVPASTVDALNAASTAADNAC